MLKKKILEKDISLSQIPKGVYCYGPDENGKIKVCPYWDIDDENPERMNGYCHYLKRGDSQNPDDYGLLWDQVKECNINDDIID